MCFTPLRWVAVLAITLPPLLAYGQSPPSSALNDLQHALAQSGTVNVVIALHDAPGAAAKQASAHAVAGQQARVMADLPVEAFTLTHQFAHVPALSGVVSSAAALDVLLAHPDVAAVDVDAGGRGGLAETVPLVNATPWHNRGQYARGVRVAVLDTGIDADHPDLQGAVVHEACFLNAGDASRCPDGSTRQAGAGAAEDDHGHGTHVAGIVASNGTDSDMGMAPGVHLVSLKMLDRTNSFSSSSEILAAFDYLIANPQLDVQVLTMSLGTFALFNTTCDDSRSWTRAGFNAVRQLNEQGVTVLAAAMNDNATSQIAYPACLSNVIAVGATDKSDRMAAYSNRNAELDVVAPGTGILSSRRGGGSVSLSGTSMATPHVAGCAALLLAEHLAPTPDDLRGLLRSSETKITDTRSFDSEGQPMQYARLDCFSDAIQSRPTGTDRPDELVLDWSIYPNPATARATLRLSTAGRAAPAQLDVFDVLGRRVATRAVPPTTPIATLDTSRWANGQYVVRLRHADQVKTKLLTVLR
ncbi:MAG: S8 family serine peptidase [Bacteroidota bacterium]